MVWYTLPLPVAVFCIESRVDNHPSFYFHSPVFGLHSNTHTIPSQGQASPPPLGIIQHFGFPAARQVPCLQLLL